MPKDDILNIFKFMDNVGASAPRVFSDLITNLPDRLSGRFAHVVNYENQDGLKDLFTLLQKDCDKYIKMSDRAVKKMPDGEEKRFAEYIRGVGGDEVKKLFDKEGAIFINLDRVRASNFVRFEVRTDIANGLVPDIDDIMKRQGFTDPNNPLVKDIAEKAQNAIKIRDAEVDAIYQSLKSDAKNIEDIPEAEFDKLLRGEALEAWVKQYSTPEGTIRRKQLLGEITPAQAEAEIEAMTKPKQTDDNASRAASGADNEGGATGGGERSSPGFKARAVTAAKYTTAAALTGGVIYGVVSLFTGKSNDDSAEFRDINSVMNLKDAKSASKHNMSLGEKLINSYNIHVNELDVKLNTIDGLIKSKQAIGETNAVTALTQLKDQVINIRDSVAANSNTPDGQERTEVVHALLKKVSTLNDQIIGTAEDNDTTLTLNRSRLNDQQNFLMQANNEGILFLNSKLNSINQAIVSASTGNSFQRVDADLIPAQPQPQPQPQTQTNQNPGNGTQSSNPSGQTASPGQQQQSTTQQSGTSGTGTSGTGTSGTGTSGTAGTTPPKSELDQLPPEIRAIFGDANTLANYSADAQGGRDATLSDGTTVKYGLAPRLYSIQEGLKATELQLAKVEQLQMELRAQGKGAEAQELENSVILNLRTAIQTMGDCQSSLQNISRAAVESLNRIKGMKTGSQLADAQTELQKIKALYADAQGSSTSAQNARAFVIKDMESNPHTAQALKDEISDWKKTPDDLLAKISGGKEGLGYQLLAGTKNGGASVAGSYLSLAKQGIENLTDGWKDYGRSLKTQSGRNWWMAADIGGKVLLGSMAINLFNGTIGSMAGIKIDGWKSLAIMGVIAAMSLHGTGEMGRSMEAANTVRDNRFGGTPYAQTGSTLNISGNSTAGSNIPNGGSVAMIDQKSGKVVDVAEFKKNGSQIVMTNPTGDVVKVDATEIDKMARNVAQGSNGNVPMNFDGAITARAGHSEKVSDAVMSSGVNAPGSTASAQVPKV